ncbi:hypothetical protein C8A05DRAFT_16832 [Staphylotrichum tortipilum]|uniref:DNA replication factor Cdt1 C-terminal domain-containing protein n=1 Tax=Staphylotrichum tortipilum TaxID=2831512 RepID=A0AAN6RS97_9PEZI|nr:hypothetical protein C8A05DRAFT_16832 [Staphylotrichum longicolle]
MPGVLTRKMRTPRGKLAATATPTTSTTTTKKLSKLQPGGKESLATAVPLFTSGPKIEVVLRSRKRKDHDEEDHQQSTPKKLCRQPEAQPVAPVAPATPVSCKKKSVRFAAFEPAASTSGRAAPTPSSASSSSRKRQLEPDDSETETEALLQRLNLSSPAAKRSKTTVHRRAPKNDFDLPKELLELLDLHAAFLKTLTVQRAHTGPAAPIDLRALYSSVTRAWGKRHVMLDDIQRLVGVLAWSPVKKPAAADASTTTPAAPFFLCDYGRDKICVEFDPAAEPGPLREPKLKMDFEANLRTLWLSSGNLPATIFIGTLPKAPLRACHARGGAHPVLASTKTQTTLDAFKRDLAEKKQQQQEKAKQPTPAAETNNLTLLERIRLKQSTATTPLPSPASLSRQAALNRAADVSAVISMLARAAGPSPRVSFALSVLAARLRDSVRTPVSLEDGAECVRVLAKEVVPGWLRVVKVGGRENVVVVMAGEVSKGEVEGRVKKLLE